VTSHALKTYLGRSCNQAVVQTLDENKPIALSRREGTGFVPGEFGQVVETSLMIYWTQDFEPGSPMLASKMSVTS
jgi:hypothetical protein